MSNMFKIYARCFSLASIDLEVRACVLVDEIRERTLKISEGKMWRIDMRGTAEYAAFIYLFVCSDLFLL